MGGLGKFAGLDRLALGGDAASGVTVSGGKYVGKNVYLELSPAVGDRAASAQVEWRAGHGFICRLAGRRRGGRQTLDQLAATPAARRRKPRPRNRKASV